MKWFSPLGMPTVLVSAGTHRTKMPEVTRTVLSDTPQADRDVNSSVKSRRQLAIIFVIAWLGLVQNGNSQEFRVGGRPGRRSHPRSPGGWAGTAIGTGPRRV